MSNPFLQQITQEAQNDPAIWSGKVLPFQRKLQAKLKAQGIAPDKPKQAINSSTLYYHADHLGTPRELTNQEGSIVWAATYKAWGNTESIEYPKIRQTIQGGNTLQEHWVEQSTHDKPQQYLRFQGQYYDEETGLHYNRFRYYDPDCGRFVSQDPIGLYGGDNLYQYAPNPTGWIDPLGLEYQPAPKDLPGFPDAQRVKPKTPVQGGGGLRKRWKLSNGCICEWDSQHGEVEMYDKCGKHLGAYDPKTGKPISGKKPIPNRRIEP